MKFKTLFFMFIILTTFIFAQESDDMNQNSLHFDFESDSIYLRIGESANVTIKLLDHNGELVNTAFSIYGTPRGDLKTNPRVSDSTGIASVVIVPFESGTHKLNVRTGYIEDQVVGEMTVEVPLPPIRNIVFNNSTTNYYSGTVNDFSYTVFD